MGQKMSGERATYVAPGGGGSVWIGDRELVTFKQTGADTDGLFALVEVIGLPGSGPPPHIHRRVDDLYCVLEGELEVLDGDRAFTARAGSVFRIPKGTLHAWKNTTDRPARALLFVCPAGFEGFFEEAGVPATDPSSPPPPPTREELRRMLELGRQVRNRVPLAPQRVMIAVRHVAAILSYRFREARTFLGGERGTRKVPTIAMIERLARTANWPSPYVPGLTVRGA